MKTATRYEQQDQQASGRFGRAVRAAPAADDVQMADARTSMQTDRAGERFEAMAYEVDADAVAAAIVSRLIAGRTFPPPAADGR